MNHDDEQRLRELCALELYEELDATERAELEQLAARSTDHRRLVREVREELARGLGALRADAPQDLPRGWREGLQAEVARAPRPRRALPGWWTAAAGFAAGALLVWGAHERTSAPTGGVTEFERFLSQEPPPPATAGSSLDRFSRYVR